MITMESLQYATDVMRVCQSECASIASLIAHYGQNCVLVRGFSGLQGDLSVTADLLEYVKLKEIERERMLGNECARV